MAVALHCKVPLCFAPHHRARAFAYSNKWHIPGQARHLRPALPFARASTGPGQAPKTGHLRRASTGPGQARHLRPALRFARTSTLPVSPPSCVQLAPSKRSSNPHPLPSLPVACLVRRLAASPDDDEAFARVCNMPPRGIPKVFDAARCVQGGVSLRGRARICLCAFGGLFFAAAPELPGWDSMHVCVHARATS